jgi:transcriptional regulator with XRE-family HTH domain
MPRHMAEETGAAIAKRLAGSEESIGQRLRSRREERGLSLRELARRVNVSPSAISKIETDKYRPSVSMLWSIVTELGLSLDELFGSATPEPAARDSRPRPSTDRTDTAPTPIGRHSRMQPADSRKAIVLESGVRWERLTSTNDPEADFLFVRYDVGGSSGKNDTFVRHSGREYGVVLSGVLEVTVGFETYVLHPGDAVSFESTTPHRLRNISDEPVTGIWVVMGRHAGDPPRDLQA